MLKLCLGLSLDRPAPHPDATALTDGKMSLSYAQLHHEVTKEAARLRHEGVGTGELVRLPDGRAIDTIVSLLAILAAGAAFAPVPVGASPDPLVGSVMSDRLRWPDHMSPSSDPAYLISTSGSTGTAKHTVVTREGLRTVFAGLHTTLRRHLPTSAVWTQLHPLTFGYALCEVLGSLAFCGTLTLVEREEPLTLIALSRCLSDESSPRVVCLTPSELAVLANIETSALPSHLILSGESAHRAPLREIFSRGGQTCPVVVNTYAATETSGQITVDIITAERLDTAREGYVGHPLPGVEVRLSDRDGAPIPCGDTVTEGEIQVRGTTVAAGYLDPAADAARFATAGGVRSFRTGDRGRWAPDGGLIVTGRAERRVKLAGSWIALDDIERALIDDGLAAEAIATVEEFAVDGTASHGRLLVAAVPQGRTSAETGGRIRRRVLRFLNRPVTVRTVVCEAIPRTRHGKADLGRLMSKETTRGSATGIAALVEGVWADLLGDGLVHDANLFESGVDSLGVVAAAVRLTNALGRRVTPAFLLDHPRIALQIRALSGDAEPSEARAPRTIPRADADTSADRRRAARSARHRHLA